MNTVFVGFLAIQTPSEAFGAFCQLVGVQSKGIRNATEQLHPFGIGKVGTSVKGLLVGHQEDIQGPPSMESHGLHGIHVDIVQVRALLAVDFDADKMGIHDGCCRCIFKTFLFHHMAPMASRVADGYQDGFVFFICSRQSLWTPGVPIHGVVRVLQEVGTLGMEQSICGHGNYRLYPEKLSAVVWILRLEFLQKNQLPPAFVRVCLANFEETCDALRNLG